MAAAVAVIAVVGYLLSSWPPEPPSVARSELPSAAARSSSGAQEPTRLVVLGDSYSAPSPASDGPEWPQLLAESLGWEATTAAVDGSGYVSQGSGAAFGARIDGVLEQPADVILVAGGVDDLGVHPMPRIVENAEDVVARLARGVDGADVVVVSPFSNDEPGPLTREFSGELQRVASAQDLPYVDATEWLVPGDDYFGDDPARPDDRGQRRIATQMEQALSELGLVD